MAQQKVVIKLEVNGERPAAASSIAKKMGMCILKKIFKHTASQYKIKAMMIAVGSKGVNLVALEGEGKDELVVNGVFNAVELVMLLRKGVGGANIKSIGPEGGTTTRSCEPQLQREYNLCNWNIPYPSMPSSH